MDDTRKVKVTNWRYGSIWTIGFLFTLGYVSQLSELSFWEAVIQLLLTYLVWPLLLGMELSGGGF
jgi:hypothetical protein